MDFKLSPHQHVHIVGIGGFGMSAIARVLLESGYRVTGSDEKANHLTDSLQKSGATVYIDHHANNIRGANVILASSAIADSNPELQAATAQNIPVLRRRDTIGFVTANYRTLAVSGTHGKTTTTALLTHVLAEAGLDPTTIVGGVMKDLGSNARVGQGEFFVIEADEYGGMFLGLHPEIAIITNIEYDHPDQFPTMESLVQAFNDFTDCIKPDGILVAGIDSAPVAAIAEARQWLSLPTITYGLAHEEAQWFATRLEMTETGQMRFEVRYENVELGSAELNLAGAHNVQNALAVIAVANQLGISFSTITDALATFAGTERRAEILGTVNGITIISDYAHHPTAIRANLQAWTNRPGQLWAVWQPHTYNRLRALADEFAHAFSDADHVIVTDVYSVRETVTPGLAPADLVARIQQAGHHDARYCGGFEQVATLLAREVQPGDTVLIFSAGDAPQIAHFLLDLLQKEHPH